MEAPPGFEPGVEVLQTSALPLGDGADRTKKERRVREDPPCARKPRGLPHTRRSNRPIRPPSRFARQQDCARVNAVPVALRLDGTSARSGHSTRPWLAMSEVPAAKLQGRGE